MPVNCERQSNGRIKMTTDTKGATIYYSIDGGEYQKYTSPVANNSACTVTAYSTLSDMFDSAVMSYDFDMYVDKSKWKLVSADSQHGGNEAKLAFDNNNSTFWHTEYQGSEPTCPHTLVVDMGSTYRVTAFTYLARQDGTQNGMVKEYEVYLSTDGKTWGQAMATGEFKNTTSLQVAKLKTAKDARYLKFVAKSEINGKAWTSAAEIGIQAAADVTGVGAALMNSGKRIEDSEKVYDLQGRRVNPSLFTLQPSPKKDIYITNGTKIIR